MKKFVFVSTILFLSYSFSYSQSNEFFSAFSDGSPVKETSYVNIEGNPYLYNDWFKSKIKLKDGRIFENVDLKYDLVQDQLLFKKPSGEVLTFAVAVSEFVLGNSERYINGINGVKNSSDKSYFQVLTNGKVKLLKKKTKDIVERREYNSSSSTKTFVENDLYYLVNTSSQTLPLKKDKKSLLSVLNDKSNELENYISSEKLNLKNDDDLVTIINYYNKLND